MLIGFYGESTYPVFLCRNHSYTGNYCKKRINCFYNKMYTNRLWLDSWFPFSSLVWRCKRTTTIRNINQRFKLFSVRNTSLCRRTVKPALSIIKGIYLSQNLIPVASWLRYPPLEREVEGSSPGTCTWGWTDESRDCYIMVT